MIPRIFIKELRQTNLEGGYLIDGFPSVGFSSTIASESMVQTTPFQLAGIVDSDVFPPISLIKNGKPNYPTRIFVNDSLKLAVFLSHLTLDQSLHKKIARKMLSWAESKKISLVVSSVSVKSNNIKEEVLAVGSTENATKKIKDAGIKLLENGTIPGIPGMLLNEGSLNNQDVVVIIFHSDGTSPDFRSSANLCMAMSKLIPGASCDIPALQKEAEEIEKNIKNDIEETNHLNDTMYR